MQSRSGLAAATAAKICARLNSMHSPPVEPGPRYNAAGGLAVSLRIVRDGYRRYTRYVAIGDSQTEGLWDGDDTVGLLGFADRLAAMVDSIYPGLEYANLAIRGKLVRHVLREQVPPALAMRPDLITVCIGMNDVIQPGRSFGPALADLERIYAALAESGATVVTATFPNVAQFLPMGRLVSGRLARINNAIRSAAQRYDFGLVDLYNAPSMRNLDTWDIDRVHASPKGHMLFAAAAAEALNLPGSNHDWAVARGSTTRLSFNARTYGQVRWAQEKFMPWVWRRLRGKSSADGRVPKRPVLEPLSVRSGILKP
nr:SGNH/GDSL hydrolase family protein [Mycobacterium conspicuum]